MSDEAKRQRDHGIEWRTAVTPIIDDKAEPPEGEGESWEPIGATDKVVIWRTKLYSKGAMRAAHVRARLYSELIEVAFDEVGAERERMGEVIAAAVAAEVARRLAALNPPPPATDHAKRQYARGYQAGMKAGGRNVRLHTLARLEQLLHFIAIGPASKHAKIAQDALAQLNADRAADLARGAAEQPATSPPPSPPGAPDPAASGSGGS